MKNIFKICTLFSLIAIICFGLIACNNVENNKTNTNKNNEIVELSTTTLDDVEFENSDTVELDKENNAYYEIEGTINAMSKSQKLTFGVEDVTHVVSLKITFDKEKTISQFEIIGNTRKVYSDTKDVDNYVGSISDLLDSEEGEDAYCYLILSANTKDYKLKVTYTDHTSSEIKLKIDATLATSVEE